MSLQISPIVPCSSTRVNPRHDIPRWLIPYKPDWKKPEHDTPFSADYYESDRALGELYRSVELLNIPSEVSYAGPYRPAPLSDTISQALRPHIESMLGADGFRNSDRDVSEVEPIFRRYADELKYICLAHSLSNSPENSLVEEEVVIGSILAHCSESRFRNDRMYRMRLNSSVLVSNTRSKMFRWRENQSEGDLRYGLVQAWRAWDFATRNRSTFGANSFAIVALGVICDVLQLAGSIQVKRDKKREEDSDSEDEG